MSNIKSSVYNSKNGRYVLGGSTETSSSSLEWWNKVELPRDGSDILYRVEKKYEGRPDLLGLLFYNDPLLWWIIAQYNTILDPFEELIEGKLLSIPILERIESSLKKPSESLGGIASTRNV